MSQCFMVICTSKANQGFAFGFASLLHFYECSNESLVRLHADDILKFPLHTQTHARQTQSELKWVLKDFRYFKGKHRINIDYVLRRLMRISLLDSVLLLVYPVLQVLIKIEQSPYRVMCSGIT